MTPPDERETAIAAADETCPRCGARREPDQRYCLECGLELPETTGRVAELRRRWIRRLGWYPGDWIWVSLLTLLVAVAGAAVAILVTNNRASASGGETFVASTTVPIQTATAVPTTTAAPPTTTAPTTTAGKPKPKPKPTGPVNGRLTWPAHENGWTIVLVSYPKTGGETAPLETAARAASHGLEQVGVLDSSQYASLQPGYFVVFTGIYGSKSDADAGVSTARQAGFGGAYSRQVSR